MTYAQKDFLTKRTRTARIKSYKVNSLGKSKQFKLGLAEGLIVGAEGKERKFLQEKINKYDLASEQEDRMIKSHFGRNFERED